MNHPRKRLTTPAAWSVAAKTGIIDAKRGGSNKKMSRTRAKYCQACAAIAASRHGKYMENGAVPAILGAMSSAG